MNDAVRTERDGEVLIITLDRPNANAIDVPTSLAMYEAFRQLEDDPSLRVGVLTGAGDRFFCAGWDLKAAAAGESADSDNGPGGFGGLTEFFGRKKPVIAALNGLALGGGFEVAISADILVAAEGVEVGLPEVRVGTAASIAAIYLPRSLPEHVAREMLLTGRRMPATEAARWGLVTKVVPREELMVTAMEIAKEICAGAPLAIASVQELLAETESLNPAKGFALLKSGRLPGFEAMLKSQDLDEGIRAFSEKRPPSWQGR